MFRYKTCCYMKIIYRICFLLSSRNSKEYKILVKPNLVGNIENYISIQVRNDERFQNAIWELDPPHLNDFHKAYIYTL